MGIYWVYLIIAAVLETFWIFSISYIDKKAIMKVKIGELFSNSDHILALLPVIGYVLFGVGNVVFFSMSMKKIPPSVAYAVWMGLALVLIKGIELLFMDEPFSWSKLLFLAMILAGIIGLRMVGGGQIDH